MAIGPIEIQILADLAGLKRDMDQAKGVVGNGMASMQDAAGKVKTAFAALGVGLSVAGVAAFVKSGIDAADMANELAQKTGLATREIAGIQLAFKQGGVSSEAMGSAMAKMSKQMVENNSAFADLGVKTRNIDGSMRDVKAVLYDTADAFAGMKDGAAKTDLAMSLFGKTGADLIPTLNEGSKGLADMADMADKLGLTIDGDTGKAADKFNDTVELLGMGTKGVATQIAAQLLPTLTSLSASFLESMTKGDALRKVADMLGTTLKGLYTAGVLIAEAFNTVGKSLGAAGAAIMAVLSGDFKGAMAIAKEAAGDVRKGWTSTADTIARAWDDSGNATVQSMAQVMKAGKEVVRQTDDQKRAIKEAAAEAKKASKEREQYSKDMLKAEAEQEKQRKAWFDAEAARELKRIAQYEKAQEAVDVSVEKAADMVAAIERETAALGLSNTEREISNALLALEKTGVEQGTYAWDVYAEKIRAAVVNKQAVAESVQHSKEIADNWKNLTQQIGQGLTDSLFRAFESGKGFFKTLWDGIVNTFKTTVLRLAINAVMSPINGAIGGLLGGGSTLANAATGGSSLGGIGSMLGGLGGALGNFGSAAGAGASALFGGTGLTALGGAGSMLGAGNLAGGLGMAAGVVGPIVGVLGALYGALKHKATPHTGAALTLGEAGAATNVGSAWRNIGSNADVGTLLSGTFGSVQGMLQSLGAVGSGGKFGVGGGFADDSSKDASWGAFGITRNGQNLASIDTGGMLDSEKFADGQAGIAAYMQAIGTNTAAAIDQLGLPSWAQEIVDALGNSPTLDQLATATQEIIAEKERLDALQTGETLVEQGAENLVYTAATNTGIEALSADVDDMANRVVNALVLLQQSLEIGLASVANASQQMAAQLRAWDDGGAIVTTPAA